MAPPVLILRDIGLSFGGTPLLETAALSVSVGDRLCLVGRNGSGKSTLLKIAAGQIEADHGERFLQPGVTVRYLPQEPDLAGHATTRAYVEAGLAPGDDAHRAQYLLTRLGLTGDEAPARLSGGEARRAALARVLAPEPDILLLDEPTNHLDLPAVEWLETELESLRSALVLISHDRRFLQNLSRATVWLSQGVTRRVDRGFAAFESWRDETLAQMARERHELDRKLAAEADWLHRGVTARRRRNQGRLRALHALRRERREQRRAAGAVKLTATEGVMSGKLVAEATEVGKAFGEKTIVRNLSIRVRRGDRLGIVGPNGAGKTTLLDMLTGSLEPDQGNVRRGVKLRMVTLDQRRDSLDPDWTLTEALTDRRGDTVFVGGQSKHVVGYMKDFLFSPEQAHTPVAALSGGERGRLMLDEPTNDLDLETLDLLQELLADYPGTVLLVSHDRDFLDRVVTSVLASEGDGRWVEYAGGYTDMLAQRGEAIVTEPREKQAQKKPPTAPRERAARQRLSYKQKHALETLPGRIEALQADIARLQAKLAEPDLYAEDPEAFSRSASALQTAEAELAAAEEEWLALELLREELEGA